MNDRIPISERLPTREDADERGEVVWKWADGTTCTGRFEDSGDEDDPAVAWLPLPRYTPPKPGPTDTECENEFDRNITIVRRWFDEVPARIEREKGRGSANKEQWMNLTEVQTRTVINALLTAADRYKSNADFAASTGLPSTERWFRVEEQDARAVANLLEEELEASERSELAELLGGSLETSERNAS